jgi:hypothetical protein
MKNRIALCNAIGMALVTLAVVCGICAIGCLGAVEWGNATILGGAIRSVLFGIATVVLGKVGYAFAVV